MVEAVLIVNEDTFKRVPWTGRCSLLLFLFCNEEMYFEKSKTLECY